MARKKLVHVAAVRSANPIVAQPDVDMPARVYFIHMTDCDFVLR